MAHLVKISLYRKHEGVEKCLAFGEAIPIMANWATLTVEQLNFVRFHIETIDRWQQEVEGRDSANRSTVPRSTSFLHCVRCHAPFVQGDSNDPCIIPHVVDTTNPEITQFQSKCCARKAMAVAKWNGRSYTYKVLGGHKYCYVGTHTTNVAALEHILRGKPGCNGKNIFPCLQVHGECVRPYVRVVEWSFAQDGDFFLKRPWLDHE
ncbi:hypothetical protein BJ912DRAFT_1042296 [Pholiota molesta]|nr:hypothetical protein BJ912DRAFT_1042296 [Pholiota molesta]